MQQNIRVRHGEVADIPAIKSIYAQESVYHGTLQLPFPAMPTWEARLSNLPAITLYKKYGFYVEGEAKAYSFRNGVYADTYFMARIRPD